MCFVIIAWSHPYVRNIQGDEYVIYMHIIVHSAVVFGIYNSMSNADVIARDLVSVIFCIIYTTDFARCLCGLEWLLFTQLLTWITTWLGTLGPDVFPR